MIFLRLRLPSILAAASLALGVMVSIATTASAEELNHSTCAGGSIAPGTYRSLTITGLCRVDSGNVAVKHNVIIAPGGGLLAVFSGSDLTIGGNLSIQTGGLLALGCEPLGGDFPCFNNPAGHTNHTIGHNLVAKDAALVIVHHDIIRGKVAQTGGGGGLNCNPVFTGGPPPYTDYNDDTIGGNVTVAGLHTCWDGFLGNTVGGTVNWNDNHTVIPDGNLMGTNVIRHNLNCFDNSPMPHLSDFTPVLNIVRGEARGQCASLSTGGDQDGD